MLLDKDVDKYLLSEDVTLSVALKALNTSKIKILFVTNDQNVLVGAFSDGDFRRWVLSQASIDLELSVKECMSKHVFFMFEDDSPSEIEQRISERYKYIPITDKNKRVVAIASRQKQAITIERFSISAHSPCFIIAEIGNNHNGDLNLAKELVDKAISSGADCVKFQMRDLPSLYVSGALTNHESEDLGSQYILDQLSRFQLSDQEFKDLFLYCKSKGIACLCTPFDEVSADKIEQLGLSGFKIASADLTNHNLLRHVARKGKPLILSTGMSKDEEIRLAVDLLRSEGAQFVLLHCNSSYPAPFKDIQLPYLKQLIKMNNGLVGYSGHERGIAVAVAAVALGAKVIEKHFTIDKEMEGNDHKVSLLPEEFSEMVHAIRQVEAAMVGGDNRVLSQGEMMNRENLGKSVVARQAVSKGDVFTATMLDVKSPGKGLAPYHIETLIGKKANRAIEAGAFLFPSDLNKSQAFKPRHYKFEQPFGIPVRYHDFEISQLSNFEIVEYHLSYQDLKLSPSDYLVKDEQQRVVVHAPELFAGDHVLDLASKDDNYRRQSIDNLNRVFEIARSLKEFYPKTRNVPVVVNVGGFSQHSFLSETEKNKRYSIVEESLKLLNRDGIQFLVQTMPPFPWHFGGQRYHNLFVHPQEIHDFCAKNDVDVCLDVSHSFLAANMFDYPLSNFFVLLEKYIKHLHIADGANVDDEGLKIGDGNIDFPEVFNLMKQHCPDATWIPEIWQGHKNQGEGFWEALEKLEAITSKH